MSSVNKGEPMKINEQVIRDIGKTHFGTRFADFADEFKKHYATGSFDPQEFLKLDRLSSDLKISVASRLLTLEQREQIKKDKVAYNSGYTLARTHTEEGVPKIMIVLSGERLDPVSFYLEGPQAITYYEGLVEEHNQLIEKYWR
jgi:hypothetical protein